MKFERKEEEKTHNREENESISFFVSSTLPLTQTHSLSLSLFSEACNPMR